MKRELYFSLDVEADGPIPGPHSMLSFAVVVFDPAVDVALQSKDHSERMDCFTMNLTTLPDARPDPVTTKEFWDKNPKAYEAARTNIVNPIEGIPRFVKWVDKVCQDRQAIPVAVAYPGSYDFMFVYWYLQKFAGRSPFGFQCLDLKTLAMATLGTSFKDAHKKNFPRAWFEHAPVHSHLALDDAWEQGIVFCHVFEQLKNIHHQKP